MPVSPDLLPHLQAGGPLLSHSTLESTHAGILILPHGPMIIASRPILTRVRPAVGHSVSATGTGYPLRASREMGWLRRSARAHRHEAIPLAARLFAVVDVWDALTSDRPYRAAWSKQRALAHMHGQSGTHFDPSIVNAFLTLVEAEPQRGSPAGGGDAGISSPRS